MILASLVSAGAPLSAISKILKSTGVSFDLSAERVEINGVQALHVEVSHPPEHEHRTFGDIHSLIENAGLPERAAARSVEIFRKLAVAEGAVHGKAPEEVTFHEVGAVDSIVDILGSCVALDLLGIDSVTCGLLPMGHGTVRAAHGLLPVPGPATLEVLKDSRIRWTEEPREMTTPTGAAITAALTGGKFTEAAPPMVMRAAGYGAGTARFESAPNLLRAVVGDLEGPAGDVELLAANVDDAPGELLGNTIERLLEAGALDAWLEPIVMKRGRGAYKVCALVQSAAREESARILMRETGSLGVRHRPVGRTVAERELVKIKLPYGKCRVKVGVIDGEAFVVAPEYADARRLSKETGLALPRVYSDARTAYELTQSGKPDCSSAEQSL